MTTAVTKNSMTNKMKWTLKNKSSKKSRNFPLSRIRLSPSPSTVTCKRKDKSTASYKKKSNKSPENSSPPCPLIPTPSTKSSQEPTISPTMTSKVPIKSWLEKNSPVKNSTPQKPQSQSTGSKPSSTPMFLENRFRKSMNPSWNT